MRVVYPVERLVQTVRLEEREPFVTADGSTIRELAGVPSGNAVNQSLAEATVPVGTETIEHFHRTSEEIYHFTSGAAIGGKSDQRIGSVTLNDWSCWPAVTSIGAPDFAAS